MGGKARTHGTDGQRWEGESVHRGLAVLAEDMLPFSTHGSSEVQRHL